MKRFESSRSRDAITELEPATATGSTPLPRRIARAAIGTRSPASSVEAAVTASFADAVNVGIHAPIARAAAAGEVAAHADAALAAAGRSTGHALPGPIQRKFESSLGVDLSGVRVHTGTPSTTAAGAVSARAFATGRDVHFGAGQYDPSSRAGEHLLAHEVAHTVQQAGGARFKLEVTGPGDACEVEADAAADAMVRGAAFSIGGAGVAIARDPISPHGSLSHTHGHGPAPFTGPSGRGQVEQELEQTTSLTDARELLAAIRAAASGAGTSPMAMVDIHLVRSGITAHVAASDLPALTSSAEAHVATLQVARTGTTLSGLAGHMPADQLAQLTTLVHTYAYGSTGSIAQISTDAQRIAELAHSITGPVDPMSAASLRQVAAGMQASLEAAEVTAGPTIGPDPGDGISLQEHDAEAQRSVHARAALAGGPFAAVFYMFTLAETGDSAEAERHAIAGSFVDSLITDAHEVSEGREGMAHPAPRDPTGHLPHEPTVTHPSDARSHMPQPVDAEGPPTEVPAPRARPTESRTERQTRERGTQASHAARMAPRRGRH